MGFSYFVFGTRFGGLVALPFIDEFNRLLVLIMRKVLGTGISNVSDSMLHGKSLTLKAAFLVSKAQLRKCPNLSLDICTLL